MRKSGKWLYVLGVALLITVLAPLAAWISLTHKPRFYRDIQFLPREVRQAEAKRFVAQSLQLRNDIRNEPNWEAAFTDQEVNAWLAEDLVTQFADLLPPEVHEPRISFEADRMTLAFQLDQGPIRSVIWVVARISVPEENVLALRIEKVRAGFVPISCERFIHKITAASRSHGLDIRWEVDGDQTTALVHYASDKANVILDRILVRTGEIRLFGRSKLGRGDVTGEGLSGRRILQSTFPSRKIQVQDAPAPLETARSTTKPTS